MLDPTPAWSEKASLDPELAPRARVPLLVDGPKRSGLKAPCCTGDRATAFQRSWTGDCRIVLHASKLIVLSSNAANRPRHSGGAASPKRPSDVARGRMKVPKFATLAMAAGAGDAAESPLALLAGAPDKASLAFILNSAFRHRHDPTAVRDRGDGGVGLQRQQES